MASSLLVWSVFQSSRNLLHLHVEAVNDRRYQGQNNQSTEPLLLIQFEYPAPHLPQTLQKDKLLQGCDIYESQHSVLRIYAINIDLVELFLLPGHNNFIIFARYLYLEVLLHYLSQEQRHLD